MSREDEIKRFWAGYRLQWPRYADGTPMPFLKIARQSAAPENPWDEQAGAAVAAEINHFTFALEAGQYDGKPANRIVCEGVVVEISLQGQS